MRNTKMYYVTTTEQFESITGCNCLEQNFRPSVIIEGILAYDKLTGDWRKGYMIFPLSTTVTFDPSENVHPSVRLDEADTLWDFVVSEEPSDGESKA